MAESKEQVLGESSNLIYIYSANTGSHLLSNQLLHLDVPAARFIMKI